MLIFSSNFILSENSTERLDPGHFDKTARNSPECAISPQDLTELLNSPHQIITKHNLLTHSENKVNYFLPFVIS